MDQSIFHPQRNLVRIDMVRRMMKNLVSGVFALALLSLVFPPQLAQAQTAAAPSTTARPFSYDASKEITLEGRVSSVLPTPSLGMVAGSHLLLTTLSSAVEVSLGVFALRGKSALSVSAGNEVEVIGMMKTLKGKEVFLARIVKVGEKIYAIRNEHGIPISPQARERANQENARQGEPQ